MSYYKIAITSVRKWLSKILGIYSCFSRHCPKSGLNLDCSALPPTGELTWVIVMVEEACYLHAIQTKRLIPNLVLNASLTVSIFASLHYFHCSDSYPPIYCYIHNVSTTVYSSFLQVYGFTLYFNHIVMFFVKYYDNYP